MQEIRACKHEGSVGMFLQVRACLVQMVHAGVSVGAGRGIGKHTSFLYLGKFAKITECPPIIALATLLSLIKMRAST